MAYNQLLTRRNFLLGASATTLLSTFPFVINSNHRVDSLCFLSACTDVNGQHYLASIRSTGELYFLLPVPFRAHDVVYLKHKKHAVFVSRNPSHFFYVVDIEKRNITHTINSQEGYHFRGHATYQEKKQLLFTSESRSEVDKGYIGIYDISNNYSKIGQFSSYGIEPHQIKLMPDNKTLVVANGGRPDKTGPILDSNISYIDIETGELLSQYRSDVAQHSLRHLAATQSGKVFVGAQSQTDELLPLVYYHNDKVKQLRPLDADEFIWQQYNQYTASLSIVDDMLAVSSPRGNITSLWNIETKDYIKSLTQNDVAGLAVYKNSLLMSDGLGNVSFMNMPQMEVSKQYQIKGLSWDNHAIAVALDS